MITEVQTAKGTAAITSDHWHVVHARWVAGESKRPFMRSIYSEHDDRAACRGAAKALRQKLMSEATRVPADERDEVFVRKPNFKSLKRAKARRTQAG